MSSPRIYLLVVYLIDGEYYANFGIDVIPKLPKGARPIFTCTERSAPLETRELGPHVAEMLVNEGYAALKEKGIKKAREFNIGHVANLDD